MAVEEDVEALKKQKSASGGYDTKVKEDTSLLSTSAKANRSENNLGGLNPKSSNRSWLDLKSYGSTGGASKADVEEDLRVSTFLKTHLSDYPEHWPTTPFEQALIAEVTKFCSFYQQQAELHQSLWIQSCLASKPRRRAWQRRHQLYPPCGAKRQPLARSRPRCVNRASSSCLSVVDTCDGVGALCPDLTTTASTLVRQLDITIGATSSSSWATRV